MRFRLLIALVWSAALFLLVGVTPAAAGPIEIAPFYGLRFGGEFKDVRGQSVNLGPAGALGLTLDIALPRLPHDKIELLVSHQETDFDMPLLGSSIDVRIDEWQGGLLHEYLLDESPARPYLVGTLGATRFSFSGPIDDETLFSVGLGGGIKYFPTENVGFRLDARAYLSFVEGNGAVACSGGCAVQYEGSVFLQGEITPSIVITF